MSREKTQYDHLTHDDLISALVKKDSQVDSLLSTTLKINQRLEDKENQVDALVFLTNQLERMSKAKHKNELELEALKCQKK
jgi:hypothetical protein